MNDNYKRLVEIIESLAVSSAHRSLEWYDEHNHILLQYQKFFPSFEDANIEITNPEFRQKCKTLDVLITKLLREYDSYRWFSLYDYHRFNQILLWIVDYANEDGSIEDILQNLKI